MEPWSSTEFEDNIRMVGQERYHDKHPFHTLMNDGHLSEEQLKVWCINRLYYQRIIPVKDAILLSKIPERSIRQRWIQRIIDHDGTPETPGGIEKWLRLGEAMGLSRDTDLINERLLPGTRFAVDAYTNFVATKPWIEGVASSLTELFAPKLMGKRIEAFEKHYKWIDPEALAYMRARLTQAPRDSEHGLELVQRFCTTRAEQEKAVAAVRYKCDILWAQLDALYYHCVAPTAVPG
jgi:pyrroloquinoline-quinone synthase